MTHKSICWLAVALCVSCASKAANVEPKTDEEKTFYAVGAALAGNLKQFGLTESELAMVQAGIADIALGRESRVPMEEFRPKIQVLAASRQSAIAAGEKKRGEEAVAKVLAEGGQKTESGAVYQILSEGTGPMPVATDTVSVHYTGTLLDGTVFDSSVQRGTPARFPLGGVIKCWTEGLQKLKVGGKMKLHCPSDIAYGDRGRPPQIPGGATLAFDVELLEIVAAPAAPAQ